PVDQRIALHRLDRAARGIDAGHLARAEARGADAPGPDVAEQIEHARAARMAFEPVAIRVLVVEPAGLLATDRIDLEFEPAFAHAQRTAVRAVADVGVFGQRFELAHRAVVLPDQRRWLEHLDHGLGDFPAQPLHAGGADLADDDVAEALEHEAWQSVRFAEHEPVPGLVVESFAQRERDVEPVHDERTVERMPAAI